MIAKPVSGFGIMVDWHEMENVARVVVKVYLNDDAKIPDSIKVNAGVPQIGRSWTVPCYALKRQSVQELMDEDAFVTVGPLHPTPPQAPRWMGPADPTGSGTTPRGSNSAGNMQLDDGGRGRWQQKSAPVNADPDRTISDDLEPNPNLRNNPISKLPDDVTTMPKMKSVIVGPSHAREPLIRVVPSLLKEKVFNLIQSSLPSMTFRFIELLIMDHDTPIPDYFNDSHLLIHLAFALYPRFGDHAMKKIALDYLDPDEESDDQESEPELIVELESDSEKMDADVCMEETTEEEIAVLDEALAIFKTPKPKRTHKVREQLEDSFLRRSKRLSIKSEGFKDAKSARKAKESPKEKVSANARNKLTHKKAQKGKKNIEIEEEPAPLGMILPPLGFAPTPYLSQNILQGIGEGFLQIQPESVSAALLKQDDIDE